MKLKHDKIADAIYIKLSNMPYAYGRDLDDLSGEQLAHLPPGRAFIQKSTDYG